MPGNVPPGPGKTVLPVISKQAVAVFVVEAALRSCSPYVLVVGALIELLVTRARMVPLREARIRMPLPFVLLVTLPLTLAFITVVVVNPAALSTPILIAFDPTVLLDT